jgi:PTH1 family peptidyl-tRNA hydrolase
MFLIVGLGNPGREYEGNRHNAGFMALDELRRALGLPDFKEKFSGVWTKGEAWGASVALLKPMTFMNVSGECVQPACAFLKVAPPDLLVVHDELDLPFGEVRLKQGGGHAGHNGLRSIIQRLGTPDFVRVRMGIGKPPAGFRGDVADYVLQNFDAMERAELPGTIDQALGAIQGVVTLGVSAAMNAVNTRAKAKQAPNA